MLSQVAHQTGANLQFPWRKVTRSISTPPPSPQDWMLVNAELTLSIKFSSTHLYSCIGERRCESQMCNAQELTQHMTPAEDQTYAT